jgi:hypothetical protein
MHRGSSFVAGGQRGGGKTELDEKSGLCLASNPLKGRHRQDSGLA